MKTSTADSVGMNDGNAGENEQKNTSPQAREISQAVEWLRYETERLEQSAARTFSGNGVDAALANAGSRLDGKMAARYRAILAALIPKGG